MKKKSSQRLTSCVERETAADRRERQWAHLQQPSSRPDQYGFRADYRQVVTDLVRWLIQRDEADVVLVPHVVTQGESIESDPRANESVEKSLSGVSGGRLHVLPPELDARETKWVIAQCAWFCGTRMHSTIAGLSSGVPTATISYSDKARGVFEGCGMGDALADPRILGTEETLDSVKDIYLRRNDFASHLAASLPAVLRTAESQMDDISNAIRLSAKQWSS